MKRAAFVVLLAGGMIGSAAWAKSAQPAPTSQPAQQNGTTLSGGKSSTPLEVYSDDGMELSQDAKKVTAHGNAKAIRGTVTLNCDTLVAYYRDKQPVNGQAAAPAKPTADKKAKDGKDGAGQNQGGGTEVWRIEAIDHVVITNPTHTIYGDHGDYNIDDAKAVITGKDLRMVSENDLITARDSMEYWDLKQQAVARGNAKAVRNDRTIEGDVLYADFAKNEQGQTAISKAHADGHVVMHSKDEVATGDHADYDVNNGIVIITGAVQLTRDQNTLNGQYAVMNLNTGVSKIYPVAPGGSASGSDKQRVKGVFIPKSRDEEPSATGDKRK